MLHFPRTDISDGQPAGFPGERSVNRRRQKKGEEEILVAGKHGRHQSMEVGYILHVCLLGTSICLGGCLTWTLKCSCESS